MARAAQLGRRVGIVLVILLGLGLFIQVQGQATTQTTTNLRSSDVSDARLEAVAKAYKQIEAIRKEYRKEYGALDSANLPAAVEEELLRQIVGAVEAEGLSWKSYASVVRAAQKDVVLNERFLPLIGHEVVVEDKQEKIKTPVAANGNLIRLEAKNLENMPISSARAALELLPGIDPGLQVRGGSPREVDVRLDGASMRAGRTNAPFIGISYTLIDEIHVETSGFSAEYGNARSAVINIQTKGESGPPALVHLDKETLQRIAQAYVAIEDIRKAYGLTNGKTLNKQQQQQVRQAEFEMGQAIDQEELEVDTYTKVLKASSSNAKLREKLFKAIKAVRQDR